MEGHAERVEEVVPQMADAIESRRTALGLSLGELAELVGVSRQTLVPVRAGLRRDYNDATIFGLARALRWSHDWYERLQRGEAPMAETNRPELADEIRTLREEVAALRALIERLDKYPGDAPRADEAR